MAKIVAKAKGCQLTVKAKLSLGEKLDEKELDNFSRKYVRGLLKVSRSSKKKIEYTGPVGISLCKRLKKPISKYEFFFVIEQFVDLIRKMGQAHLDINQVVFEINHIFINEQTKELQFVYLPLEQARKADLFDIMYHVIYSAKPMPEPEDDYVSRFTYFLRGLQDFDPEEIEAYIAKKDRKVVDIIKRHNTGSFTTGRMGGRYDGEKDDEGTSLLGAEETVLLEEDEATGLLLEEDCGECATLYRVLTDETIRIDKPVYRLGKEKSYSDYFINNNHAVSRSHADIVRRGQKYFIMDLNSKNRTFVNGTPIHPRQEVKLQEGDKVTLGNEEFVFHV